jgi:hypothetical protein
MRFFIVALNNTDTRHRLLQIDRTIVSQDELRPIDDGAVRSAKEINAALKSLDEQNRAGGGIGKSRVLCSSVNCGSTIPHSSFS